MSTEENKALSRRWREEIDKENLDALDEFIAPDVVMHFSGNPEPLDFEGARQMLGMFYTAFPDLSHTFHDQIAEGDRVTLRMTSRSTHQEEVSGHSPNRQGGCVRGNRCRPHCRRQGGGALVHHG